MFREVLQRKPQRSVSVTFNPQLIEEPLFTFLSDEVAAIGQQTSANDIKSVESSSSELFPQKYRNRKLVSRKLLGGRAQPPSDAVPCRIWTSLRQNCQAIPLHVQLGAAIGSPLCSVGNSTVRPGVPGKLSPAGPSIVCHWGRWTTFLPDQR